MRYKNGNLYQQCVDYKKANPDASVKEIAAAVGCSVDTWYRGKSRAKKESEEGPIRKYTRRPKVLTLPVDTTTLDERVVAFVGSTGSVVKSIQEFLRG